MRSLLFKPNGFFLVLFLQLYLSKLSKSNLSFTDLRLGDFFGDLFFLGDLVFFGDLDFLGDLGFFGD